MYKKCFIFRAVIAAADDDDSDDDDDDVVGLYLLYCHYFYYYLFAIWDMNSGCKKSYKIEAEKKEPSNSTESQLNGNVRAS